MRDTGRNSDDDGGKLVPEWQVDEDDQVVLAGLAVVLALILGIGWFLWRSGGDDDAAVDVATDAVATVDGGEGDEGAPGDGTGPAPTVAPSSSTTTSTEPTSTTVASTTAAPEVDASGPGLGDIEAAVAPMPGVIVASGDGTTVTLEGFVANDLERIGAGNAAAAVEGVASVRNELVVLEPPAAAALEEAGVVDPEVAGVGTELTIRGVIQSEAERSPALAAVAAVPGVTSVIDQLMVSVAADLNALPQVQFATGSSRILPVSHADLDAAAELITAAGEVELRVDGWTDTRGDDAANMALSRDRAEAVVAHLVAAGVDPERLTAVGNGETEQFAAGDSEEALAANRVVRFVQAG